MSYLPTTTTNLSNIIGSEHWKLSHQWVQIYSQYKVVRLQNPIFCGTVTFNNLLQQVYIMKRSYYYLSHDNTAIKYFVVMPLQWNQSLSTDHKVAQPDVEYLSWQAVEQKGTLDGTKGRWRSSYFPLELSFTEVRLRMTSRAPVKMCFKGLFLEVSRKLVEIISPSPWNQLPHHSSWSNLRTLGRNTERPNNKKEINPEMTSQGLLLK